MNMTCKYYVARFMHFLVMFAEVYKAFMIFHHLSVCEYVKGLTFAKKAQKRGLLKTLDRCCLVNELHLPRTRCVICIFKYNYVAHCGMLTKFAKCTVFM